MSLLLDTHIFLWMLAEAGKLTESEARAIRDPVNRIFVSIASLWEMAIKAALGRLTIPEDLVTVLRQNRIQVLSIEAKHALAVATLPPHHKDPFDRLLVAQAMHEGLTLVTRDSWIAAYPVATLPA